MSNAGMPTRKRKRSEAHSSPSPSPSPRSPSPRPPSPRSPSAPHPSQQPAQSPPVYPSVEATAQAGKYPAVVASERDHTRPTVSASRQHTELDSRLPKLSATQVPLPSSANHPSSTRSHSHSQPFVQSWLESSAYGESPDQPASTPVSPQPVTTPQFIAPVLPLTTSNLRVLDFGTMASSVQSTRNSGSKSDQPKTVARLRDLLLLAHIWTHNPNDASTFAEIIDLGKIHALGDTNDTVMSDYSAQRASEQRHQWSAGNETSFLFNFFHIAVFKLDRKVFDDTQGKAVDKTWASDGIFGGCDWLFRPNCMANLCQETNFDKNHLNPEGILTIPKPDIAYGFSLKHFPREEQATILKFVDLYMVCPQLVSVFFLVECKSYGQNIENAEIQASRGAAAVLCAQRQLDTLANFLNDKGNVDMRSRVFSLTINQTIARLSVHWIEIDGETLQYHLHHIKHYVLEDHDQIKALRRDVYKVVDWGMFTHRKEVEKTLAVLKNADVDKMWPNGDEKSGVHPKKRKGVPGFVGS